MAHKPLPSQTDEFPPDPERAWDHTAERDADRVGKFLTSNT
jgi:hypothetical protein